MSAPCAWLGDLYLRTYLVVQHLILLFHTCHEGILAEIRRLILVLCVCSLDLFVQGLHVGRQQPSETKSVSLLITKGASFVEVRCLQQCRALLTVNLHDHVAIR